MALSRRTQRQQQRPNVVIVFLFLSLILSILLAAYSIKISLSFDIKENENTHVNHAIGFHRDPNTIHLEEAPELKISNHEKDTQEQTKGDILNFHLDSHEGQETPKQSSAERDSQKEDKSSTTPEPGYHVVFSTDCSSFQRWQSYLLFYSAHKVHQPGIVTRIASGCNRDEEEREKTFHEMISNTMSHSFKLHLTPHFSRVKDEQGKETGKDYKFFNKPFGLLHWLENSDEKIEDDDIIILLDPDQVFTRPITNDFSNLNSNLLVGNAPKTKVEHGSPFAQKYGLGAMWLEFDLETITNSTDTPARKVDRNTARQKYPAGPPYLATAKDMLTIARYWATFVPRVHAEYPHLLAEMYAFCIAAAHVKLPMQIVTSLMVSDASVFRGEGWPLLQNIPDDKICSPTIMEDEVLPSVLHYCQRYMVGEYMFGKRRMPTDIFSCESPLLKLPPPNIALQYDYFIPPPPSATKIPDVHKPLGRDRVKRDSFMICALTNILNEASLFFQRTNCDSDKSNDTLIDLWLGKRVITNE